MSENHGVAEPADLSAFLDEVLVVCPRCAGQAVIRGASTTPRMTCSHCGAVRIADEQTPRLSWGTARRDGYEPSFGFRLWLVEECCGGEVLWAFNERHLSYLERFIASTDRDRDFPSPAGDRGLAYKLPKWMQLARNRAELLRTIDRLRVRLS